MSEVLDTYPDAVNNSGNISVTEHKNDMNQWP